MRVAAMVVLFGVIPGVSSANLTRFGSRVDAVLSAPAEKLVSPGKLKRRIGYKRETKVEQRMALHFENDTIGHKPVRNVTRVESWSEHTVKAREQVRSDDGWKLEGKDPYAALGSKLIALRTRLERATPTARRAVLPVLGRIIDELATATFTAPDLRAQAEGATMVVVGTNRNTPDAAHIEVRSKDQRTQLASITFTPSGVLKFEANGTVLTEAPAVDGVAAVSVTNVRTSDAKYGKTQAKILAGIEAARAKNLAASQAGSQAATADLLARYHASQAATGPTN